MIVRLVFATDGETILHDTTTWPKIGERLEYAKGTYEVFRVTHSLEKIHTVTVLAKWMGY